MLIQSERPRNGRKGASLNPRPLISINLDLPMDFQSAETTSFKNKNS